MVYPFFMSEDHVKNEDIVEKELDLSAKDEENFAEVTVEVPQSEGNGTYYKYTVKVGKESMSEAIMGNSFKSFWETIEKKVLEDINKV